MLSLWLALAFTGWMALIIVGSLRHDPYVWQDDLPQAIRATLPPVSPETRRRKRAWGLPLLVGLVGFVAAAVHWTSTPLEAAAAAFVAFQAFNLFDALVIDVGLILWWAPEWAVPPEVRGHPALRDPRFHVLNYVKGAIGGVFFAALVAGVAALVG